MSTESHLVNEPETGMDPLPAEDWFESSETLQKLRKHKKFPTI